MALFTAETAALMAKRSWEARRLAEEQLRIAADPVPLPADNSYVEKRLSRVRLQIESLSSMLESEEDAQKIDRLANAIARLSEIERQLANRPLPHYKQHLSQVKPMRLARVEPVELPACVPNTPIGCSPTGQPTEQSIQSSQEPNG